MHIGMAIEDVGGVIFDMDGLLLDTEALARRTWGSAATDCGFEMDDELFNRLIGRSRKESHEILRTAYGEGFSLEQFRRRCSDHWEACISAEGIAIKPGVAEVLDLLDDAAVPRAVATSTGRGGAERSLAIAGILDRFEHLVTGDMVERGKPAPDIFLLAAERIGVEPGRCVVFEDSHSGITAAHAAGMTAVMVPDLLAPTDEIARLAHAILPSLVEARTLLAEALGVRVPGGLR